MPLSSILLEPSSTATVLGNLTTKDDGSITAFGGVLILCANQNNNQYHVLRNYRSKTYGVEQ